MIHDSEMISYKTVGTNKWAYVGEVVILLSHPKALSEPPKHITDTVSNH